MKNIKIRKAFASLTILSLVISPIAQVNAITFQGSIDNSINVSKYEALANTDEILAKVPNTLEFEPMTYDEALKIDEDPNDFFSYLDYQLGDKINDIIKSRLAEINLTDEDYYLQVEDIHTCKVYLLENKNFDKVIGEKTIKISYTGSYNTSDEQYVKNKAESIDFSGLISEYDMTIDPTEEIYEEKAKEFANKIKERINDNSMDVLATYGSFGGGGYGDIGVVGSHVNLFKNNILYQTIVVNDFMVNTVYVPDSVEDTDKAYIDYALPIITEFYKENYTVTNVEKTTDEYIIDDDFVVLKNNGEFYKVNFNESDEEGNKCWSRIIIKKKVSVPEIIEGDLDGNNIINANDAAIALDLYKYGNVTPEQLKAADMDENGIINANDAALILDIYKYGN